MSEYINKDDAIQILMKRRMALTHLKGYKALDDYDRWLYNLYNEIEDELFMLEGVWIDDGSQTD